MSLRRIYLSANRIPAIKRMKNLEPTQNNAKSIALYKHLSRGEMEGADICHRGGLAGRLPAGVWLLTCDGAIPSAFVWSCSRGQSTVTVIFKWSNLPYSCRVSGHLFALLILYAVICLKKRSTFL